MEDFSFLNLEQDPNMKLVQEKIRVIAEELFEDYCIKCESGGEHKDRYFRFAELEFYYYKKGKFDSEWNKVTYPREKNAGELFFHYSGMDICFQSHFDKNDSDKVFFGGMLVRSVFELDENDMIILHAGPLYVANLVLNSCKNTMPKLVKMSSHKVDLKQTLRYGTSKSATADEIANDLELCFYINQYMGQELNWKLSSEHLGWDMQAEDFKFMKRNYKKQRFGENG